jgi:hypothetical protein
MSDTTGTLVGELSFNIAGDSADRVILVRITVPGTVLSADEIQKVADALAGIAPIVGASP